MAPALASVDAELAKQVRLGRSVASDGQVPPAVQICPAFCFNCLFTFSTCGCRSLHQDYGLGAQAGTEAAGIGLFPLQARSHQCHL